MTWGSDPARDRPRLPPAVVFNAGLFSFFAPMPIFWVSQFQPPWLHWTLAAVATALPGAIAWACFMPHRRVGPARHPGADYLCGRSSTMLGLTGVFFALGAPLFAGEIFWTFEGGIVLAYLALWPGQWFFAGSWGVTEFFVTADSVAVYRNGVRRFGGNWTDIETIVIFPVESNLFVNFVSKDKSSGGFRRDLMGERAFNKALERSLAEARLHPLIEVKDWRRGGNARLELEARAAALEAATLALRRAN